MLRSAIRVTFLIINNPCLWCHYTPFLIFCIPFLKLVYRTGITHYYRYELTLKYYVDYT